MSASEPANEKISDKLRRAAGEAARRAVDPRRARDALGTRLVLAGLAGVCLAGGVDYFQNADAIKAAVAGIARETGHTTLAATMEDVDRQVEGAKQEALTHLPLYVRQHFSTVALALGLVSLGVGTRLKLTASEHPGLAVRDIGRIIAAPGFVGIVGFTLLSLRSARLRAAFGSFGRKLIGGELGWGDLGGLTLQYAPWAWREVGAVAILGASLALLAIVTRLVPIRRESLRPKFDFARRVTFWAGLLLLGYYLVATAAAVASYGSALTPYLTWPWRLTRGAFLNAVTFMSVGIAMSRTGTLMHRRAARQAEPA